jgi:phosphoribosyl-AMP cyclohydrolase / phosphoribosyl-ATP pyrophosphohydrolase
VSELVYDSAGLITAVVQDRLTGQVRMVAWMNAEALRRTLATGRATFYSRSRQSLWEKGETSGNGLVVSSVHADCDADTLLVLVDPEGPSCHTGRPACFFRRVAENGEAVDEPREAAAFLWELEAEIATRAAAPADRSYTKTLLDAGAPKIGDKLREEADELARAIDSESEDRVASEAADVVYHLLVGLKLRGVPLRRVIEVLAGRAGVSGLDEKKARAAAPKKRV